MKMVNAAFTRRLQYYRRICCVPEFSPVDCGADWRIVAVIYCNCYLFMFFEDETVVLKGGGGLVVLCRFCLLFTIWACVFYVLDFDCALILIGSTYIFVCVCWILQIYDQISTRCCVAHRLPPSDAVKRERDATDSLRESAPSVREGAVVHELRNILSAPHFKVGHKLLTINHNI